MQDVLRPQDLLPGKAMKTKTKTDFEQIYSSQTLTKVHKYFEKFSCLFSHQESM